MKIETFQQREKAESIYMTYFDTDVEHLLGFDLFDTLNFYGAISEKEYKKLCKKFEKIGDKLYSQIAEFDKEQLTKL